MECYSDVYFWGGSIFGFVVAVSALLIILFLSFFRSSEPDVGLQSPVAVPDFDVGDFILIECDRYRVSGDPLSVEEIASIARDFVRANCSCGLDR